MRDEKYDCLLKKDTKTTKWQTLYPKSELYLFVPRDEELLEFYEKYSEITEVFPINSVGIVTSRDNFVIDFDKEALRRRIRIFRDEKMPDELIRQTFNLKNKSNWKLKVARERIRKDENWEKTITQILYRPFDTQWIFYHEAVIERSRKEVMRHMMQENLGLIFHKREELLIPYSHFLVTTGISEHGCLSSKTTCYQAPLYLYPDTDKKDLFSHKKVEKKEANLNPELVKALLEVYKYEPTPEEIFYYIYSVLYSNTYRKKYAEFLKIDFPRVPFTKDYKVFNKLAVYGKRLVDLHLLKSGELDPPIAKFQGKGEDKVEKAKYEPVGAGHDLPRVYVNHDQYFEGVKQEVWEYQIGGYQVCNKWLKDRKGERLSLDDIKHYCNVVTSIQKTIEISKAIDYVYPEVEKETIEITSEGRD